MSRNLFARATESLMSNESSSGVVPEVGGSAGSNISSISDSIVKEREFVKLNHPYEELELLTPVEFVLDWIAKRFADTMRSILLDFFESLAVESDIDIPF